MSPVTAKPSAKDESLKKLKSEIEMIVTSAKSYAYKSPQTEFEEHLVREFGDDEQTLQKIKIWLLKFRASNPHGFTAGKNYNLNYDALIGAKDDIRLELELERKKQEEEEKRERELKDAIRLEKARLAREKKEEEKRRKPWLKSNVERQEDPFKKTLDKQQPNFGASLVSANGLSRRRASAAFKDTGKFVYDKSSGAQSPFGTFGEKELRLPWEEDKKPAHQRIKIKEKSVGKSAAGAEQPKSAKRIVQELVSRNVSHNNTLNKSGSEVSLTNKRLVPLTTSTSNLVAGRLKQPPVAPASHNNKKDKLLEDFFSKNYTNK